MAQSSSSSTGFALDPRDLLNAVRRRKWWLVGSTLLVGAAVALGTMRQPKIYQAKAQILIEPQVPKVLGNDVAVDEPGEAVHQHRVFLNTQYTTITSRVVLRDVIARLDLANDPQFRAIHKVEGLTGDALERALEEGLAATVRVVPEPSSRVVGLVVEDQDAKRAAKIANTLGQAYIDYSLERRLENTRGASKWLDERVTEFGRLIEAREKELYEFKNQNKLISVSLEDRLNMTAASIGILNSKMIENRTKLIELEARQAILRSQLTGTEDDLPPLQDSQVLIELRSALVRLTKQQAELTSRYGEKHPSMIALDKQIEELRGQVRREVSRMITSTENEIAALRSAERGLTLEMTRAKDDAMALSSLFLDYSKLNRDLGTTQTMYQSLLKRQTEADLSGLLKSNFVRWFQEAEPVYTPVRPSVPKNAMLGLLVGLLLGTLVVVGEVLLDNTVHSQADIEHVLGLPFLGVLPKILEEPGMPRVEDRRLPNERDLYILRNPKSAIAECARSIRTNLLFMGADKRLKRILFTSARLGEGKSTTTVQVGVTMAQAGNRVLVIDTDLRKPRLHRAFRVSGEVGLTSLLVDAATPEQAIKSTEVVGLDILPCGPIPPNPSELLHSEKFLQVLNALSDRYDRVLLDSPPIGVVTDAAILSKQVDGTLLVVHASGTPKELVRRAARLLQDVDANILGVVLNNLDVTSGSYGYSHYSYERYGYTSEAEEQANA